MLPIAHSERNPIELARSNLKQSVAGGNKEFKLASLGGKAGQILSKIDANIFTRYVQKVMKEENEYSGMSEKVDEIDFRTVPKLPR